MNLGRQEPEEGSRKDVDNQGEGHSLVAQAGLTQRELGSLPAVEDLGVINRLPVVINVPALVHPHAPRRQDLGPTTGNWPHGHVHHDGWISFGRCRKANRRYGEFPIQPSPGSYVDAPRLACYPDHVLLQSHLHPSPYSPDVMDIHDS